MNEKNELTAQPTSFGEKISFTADTVAFARTKSGIPHCQKIFEIAEEIGGPLNAKEKERTEGRPDLHAYVEARYLLTDEELKKSGIRQVLELASGLSPRGFIAVEDPFMMKYFEIDLPDKMALKRAVIFELRNRLGAQRYDNLCLFDGDVTDADRVKLIDTCFSQQSVFIICEGLLRYLNWEDKEKLAMNIRYIMENHSDSIWVTPDIHLLSDLYASPQRIKNHEQTVRDWGKDVRPNLFRDLDHAYEFFRGFGFVIRERSLADMTDQLVLPKRLGMTDEAVAEALKGRKAFIMTL